LPKNCPSRLPSHNSCMMSKKQLERGILSRDR
jgi:hypothetical protein